MTRCDLWAHPHSLATEAAAQSRRIAEAGFTAVRLAHIYHSGRWLLTTSRPGEVAQLPSGAWYAPDPLLSWGPQLRAPRATPHDAVAAATGALRSAGLAVVGWIVGLHSSPLATTHPELALRNVFGHVYRHALCPAQPAVRRYAAALVADVAARGVDELDLEAYGYLGWQHASAHDKTGVTLRPADRWLLSLCTCSACARAYREAGADPRELRERAGEAVRRQLAEPGPAAPETADDAVAALGGPLHDAVLRARAAVTTSLIAETVAAAGSTPVWLRATCDPYAGAGKTGGDPAALTATGAGLTLTDLTGDFAALRSELHAAEAAGVSPDRLTVGWSLLDRHTLGRADLDPLTETASGYAATAFYAYDLAPAARLGWPAAALAPAGAAALRKPVAQC
ncbi:hypothetical protein [Actinoplanes sp. NPDC049118]|uniref:hypothetical protein n=1 Tax=Actinoplanes sp. NPDC049118 TaxID=3155769 RepID=UPI003400F40A